MDLIEKRLESDSIPIQQQACNQIIQSKSIFLHLLNSLRLHLHNPNIRHTILQRKEWVPKQWIQECIVSWKDHAWIIEFVIHLDLDLISKLIPDKKDLILQYLESCSIDQILEFSPLIISFMTQYPQETSLWLSYVYRIHQNESEWEPVLFQWMVEIQALYSFRHGFCWLSTLCSVSSNLVDNDLVCHFLLQEILQTWIDQKYIHLTWLYYLGLKLPLVTDSVLEASVVVLSICSLESMNTNSFIDLLKASVEKTKDSRTTRLLFIPCLLQKSMNPKNEIWSRLLGTVVSSIGKETKYNDLLMISKRFHPLYQTILEILGHGGSFFKWMEITTAFPSLKTLLFGSLLLPVTSDISSTLFVFLDTIVSFRKQDMLPILTAFVYLLQSHTCIHFMITKCIPKLLVWNDAFIAASSIQLVLSFVQPRSSGFNLERAGLESLLEMFALQKRTWNHLKLYLSQWADRFKRSDRRVKSKTEIKDETDLEHFVTETIKSLSQDASKASDLLPLIVSLLKMKQEFGTKMARDLDTVSFGNLMEALLYCIENEVTTTQAAWNVILEPYLAKIDDSRKNLVYQYVCRFYGIVAEKTHPDVEKQVLFRNEMLLLLLPLLETCPKEAYEAITYFPWEDVKDFCKNPLDIKNDILKNGVHDYRNFLKTRIEIECRDMSRPVFKGIATEQGGKKSSMKDSKNMSLKLQQLKTSLKDGGILSLFLGDYPIETINKEIQRMIREIHVNESFLEDCFMGWCYFWSHHLHKMNNVGNDAARITFELKDMLSKTDIPKQICLLITCISSLLYKCHQAGQSIRSLLSEWFLECQTYFEKSAVSLDVRAAILISLFHLSKLSDRVGDYIFRQCISHTSYMNGLVGGGIIAITLGNQVEKGVGMLNEFLATHFDKKMFYGSCIGLAVVLNINGITELCPQLDTLIRRLKDSIPQMDQEQLIPCCYLLKSLGSLSDGIKSKIEREFQIALSQRNDQILKHLVIGLLCVQNDIKSILDLLDSESNAIREAGISGLQYFYKTNEIINVTNSIPVFEKLIDLSYEQPLLEKQIHWLMGHFWTKLEHQTSLTEAISLGDPTDYTRLNPETSYLRMVFEALQVSIETGNEKSVNEIFSVLSTQVILPPVDWSFLLDLQLDLMSLYQFSLLQSGRKAGKSITKLFLIMLPELLLKFPDPKIQTLGAQIIDGMDHLFSLLESNIISVDNTLKIIEIAVKVGLSNHQCNFGVLIAASITESVLKISDVQLKNQLSEQILLLLSEFDASVNTNAMMIMNFSQLLFDFVDISQDLGEREYWILTGVISQHLELVPYFFDQFAKLLISGSHASVYALAYLFYLEKPDLVKWLIWFIDSLILNFDPMCVDEIVTVWSYGIKCMSCKSCDPFVLDWKIHGIPLSFTKSEMCSHSNSEELILAQNRLKHLIKLTGENSISMEVNYILK